MVSAISTDDDNSNSPLASQSTASSCGSTEVRIVSSLAESSLMATVQPSLPEPEDTSVVILPVDPQPSVESSNVMIVQVGVN